MDKKKKTNMFNVKNLGKKLNKRKNKRKKAMNALFGDEYQPAPKKTKKPTFKQVKYEF